ncbi:MCE family protein [Mycolicibacterium holsaticum]|uniref:Mammalian cell entry protein n=1 Tax=Mycolicibacterium holsaticum TaxID=152142 RepID=A0A1E3S3K0_9MYCO|nr:MCE family protein [Mycolicibacterium holsaticum]ODQ96641.1 mammalian cell entry protein [Mycolicibacterium holsaticum]
MKPLLERNLTVVGAIGVGITAGVVLAALQYDKLPFFSGGERYSAYFTEAGGLQTGADVQVAGYTVGQVSGVDLDGDRVLVTFDLGEDITLGDRSEAAIKTNSLLGVKVLDVRPLGEKPLLQAIPVDRTRPAYQLPDALGDLSTTISNLNTNELNASLSTLAHEFANTPADLKVAIDGVARFSKTLSDRDQQLRELLANARSTAHVLANRTDQVVSLIEDSDALLAQLRTESAALDATSGNVSAVAEQLAGFIADNRATLKPSLDKLNAVLTLLDNRHDRLQEAIKLFNPFILSLGESVSSGPFFKPYIVNLLPGQFIQPFVEGAFSDLGLDPNVLLPSQLTDPQIGQPAAPALPVPFPRTGQGGEPRLTLPDAITGKPGDPRYPYREPLPAAPPGGPPPGPPAGVAPPPSPTPVLVPGGAEESPVSSDQTGGAR